MDLFIHYDFVNSGNEYGEVGIILIDFDIPPFVLYAKDEDGDNYFRQFLIYYNDYKIVNIYDMRYIANDKIKKELTDDFPFPLMESEDDKIIKATGKLNTNHNLRKEFNIFDDLCPLCMRIMPFVERSRHHLVPASEGGNHGKKVAIHRICHRKIHSVLTEKELAITYNTIELLKEHPEIEKFIKWVKNKPDNYYDNSIRTNTRTEQKN